MLRHNNTRNSARQIIDYILSLKGQGIVLEIQREMVDEKLELDQTGARSKVKEELINEKKKYRKRLEEI